MNEPKDLIRARALELGFEAFGVASAEEPWPAEARLRQFIELGRHGTMEWMAETLERRVHPRAMWPEARSAIMLGANYGPDHNPLDALEHRSHAAVSVYAAGDDYHDVIKKRLKALGQWIAREFRCELKVFVDTAPLMEKPLAGKAGLGWQGKHTNLVSRTFGSWLFLGAILTNMPLPVDAAETDHCGSCRACLDICPTAAFPAPYQLDARRCISYLTIEHRGPIPSEFRARLGNRIYGCDDCLAVCPWNKFAATAQEAAFHARDVLQHPSFEDLAALDDARFRETFRKSPIKRIGRERFVRNVLYAMGNSDNPALLEQVRLRLTDESPIVRAAAVWALSRLVDEATFQRCRADAQSVETDDGVLAEWRQEPVF